MTKLCALLAALALCAALAVPAFGATKTVGVGPLTKFRPASLTIKRGDSIRFRWSGALPHDVFIQSGPRRFRISGLRSRGTVTKRFTVAGSYLIVCRIHLPGMRLRLRVR